MEKRIIEDERTVFKAIINDKLEKVVIAFLNSKCYYVIFPIDFTTISESVQVKAYK